MFNLQVFFKANTYAIFDKKKIKKYIFQNNFFSIYNHLFFDFIKKPFQLLFYIGAVGIVEQRTIGHLFNIFVNDGLANLFSKTNGDNFYKIIHVYFQRLAQALILTWILYEELLLLTH